MSEPNWVALGGGAVDYVGGWAAGTAYRAGDVVRHNGIEYLAVNPSTGQTPAPAAPLLTGRELAYAEMTAISAAVTNGSEASAHTILTAPAVTVDGATQILVEFFAPFARTPAVVGQAIYIAIYDGAASIGKPASFTTPAASALDVPCWVSQKLTPSAGTHAYSIRAYVSSGSGLIVAGAGGAGNFSPGFIRISTVQPTAVAVRTFTAPGIGTSLPASPVDGDEYILVDSLTAPTYQWHFRYMASITDAYKWVFIGGAPATVATDAAQSTTSVTYTDLTTPGPSVTAPRAGLYRASFSAVLEPIGAADPKAAYVALKIGAAAATDNGFWLSQSGTQAQGATPGSTVQQVTAAASDLLKLVYRAGNASTPSTFTNRRLSIQPVRVA